MKSQWGKVPWEGGLVWGWSVVASPLGSPFLSLLKQLKLSTQASVVSPKHCLPACAGREGQQNNIRLNHNTTPPVPLQPLPLPPSSHPIICSLRWVPCSGPSVQKGVVALQGSSRRPTSLFHPSCPPEKGAGTKVVNYEWVKAPCSPEQITRTKSTTGEARQEPKVWGMEVQPTTPLPTNNKGRYNTTNKWKSLRNQMWEW